jgi:hypothetical protein
MTLDEDGRVVDAPSLLLSCERKAALDDIVDEEESGPSVSDEELFIVDVDEAEFAGASAGVREEDEDDAAFDQAFLVVGVGRSSLVVVVVDI